MPILPIRTLYVKSNKRVEVITLRICRTTYGRSVVYVANGDSDVEFGSVIKRIQRWQ